MGIGSASASQDTSYLQFCKRFLSLPKEDAKKEFSNLPKNLQNILRGTRKDDNLIVGGSVRVLPQKAEY